MSRRRGRRLTAEEEAIWRSVAQSARRRPQTPKTVTIPKPTVPAARAAAADRVEPDAKPPRVLKPAGRSGPKVTLPTSPAKPSSGLDRANETRLRRGKRAPDARIDLHGMTAARAHAALTSFIVASSAMGRRCVLVITGKGGAAGSGGAAPREPGASVPGVLRREAPVWLAAPALRPLIVHTSPAHPRHGGDGALYVYLKRIR